MNAGGQLTAEDEKEEPQHTIDLIWSSFPCSVSRVLHVLPSFAQRLSEKRCLVIVAWPRLDPIQRKMAKQKLISGHKLLLSGYPMNG